MEVAGKGHWVGEGVEDDADGFGDGIAGRDVESDGDDDVGIGEGVPADFAGASAGGDEEGGINIGYGFG